MKRLFLAAALLAVSACASTPTPYAPARSDSAKGYSEMQIETGRYRVAYRGDDSEQARNYALLRAAEVTIADGGDWFEVTHSYAETEPSSAGRTSVSVGGATGSRGSSVGLGVGIGLGGFGGGSGAATQVLEIVIGTGEKPDDPDAYDARSVQASILGAPQP